MNKNPFVVNKYVNPKCFCGRREEVELALTKLNSGENIELVSSAGLGKTTLIEHIFYQTEKANTHYLSYLDLYNISNKKKLIIEFLSAIIEAFVVKSKKKVNKINELIFGNFKSDKKALIRFSEQELEMKFKNVIQFLKTLKKPTILAIDNFQYFKKFEDKFNIDSFLLPLIHVENIALILSGAEKSKYLEYFTIIKLERIHEDLYKRFIIDLLNETNRSINKKSLSLLYSWTDGETAAIQLICSKLWSGQIKNIKSKHVIEVIENILNEQKKIQMIIKNLLSNYQWKLLRAIAIEDLAKQVTSAKFMEKYELNAPSSVKTALTALIEKELIVRIGTTYRISNIILRQGLKAV